MTIKLKLTLASGQSLKGAPLELLSKGLPIARAVVDEHGHVVFDAISGTGELAVRVDRSMLEAHWQEDHLPRVAGTRLDAISVAGLPTGFDSPEPHRATLVVPSLPAV